MSCLVTFALLTQDKVAARLSCGQSPCLLIRAVAIQPNSCWNLPMIAGGFSFSGGSTDTMLFAPDTSALSGDSYYLGGGVTCPIPNTPIAGSSMDNILRTADGYWGTNSTTGISFPASTKIGGEVHGGYSYTKKWTKQFNIFNGLDKLVEWYLSK